MMKKTVSRRSTNLEKKYHQPTPSTRRAPGSWMEMTRISVKQERVNSQCVVPQID